MLPRACEHAGARACGAWESALWHRKGTDAGLGEGLEGVEGKQKKKKWARQPHKALSAYLGRSLSRSSRILA